MMDRVRKLNISERWLVVSMEIEVWNKIQEGAYSKKDSADTVSAEQLKCTKLPNLLQKLCANVYSAYEVGLFYHATLDCSLSYKHSALFSSRNQCIM
jgi:hypothetical protein